MYITELAFQKIKEFEGCKLQAYQDAASVWTIGYGHTYNVREGDRISQQYADEMLQEDIENVERQLIATHDPEILRMTKAQFDAVVCLVFNIGIQRWRTSTLRSCIMKGKSVEVINTEWTRWSYAGGKRLAGLVKRRQWEVNRFFEPSESWEKNY